MAFSSAFRGSRACLATRAPAAAPLSRTTTPITCGLVTAESRIGKQPITLPKGVTVSCEGSTISVKGPRGELSKSFPDCVEVKQDGDNILWTRKEVTKKAKAFHGLARAVTQNMVTGVSEGWTKNLVLVGVGYRAEVKGNDLELVLGFSHPVVMEIPEGIKVSVTKLTNVAVEGIEKELVGNFAATIRAKRPPEPYKGKGVKYQGEYILRKEGKRGK